MKAITKTAGAVIYTRVSTADQSDNGTSLTTQRERCLGIAAGLGMPVVEVCEDAGVSGTRYTSRPGIMRALHLIESGQASIFIATKIDRIGRSARIILDIADRIEKAGGELRTSDLSFDRTPFGAFVRTIFAAVAEMERGQIRERSLGGKQQRAQEGIQTSRTLSPYGYHIPSHADGASAGYSKEQVGRYIVVEGEAEVVRRLFADYATGAVSLPQVCRTLNGQGIPTKTGKVWRPSSLRYILSNPIYKGVAAYGKHASITDEGRLALTNPHTGQPFRGIRVMRDAPPSTWVTWDIPALVPEKQWEAVQSRLQDNRKAKGGNPQLVRMLSARVFCPLCGSPCHAHHPGRRSQAENPRPSVYVCSRHTQGLILHGEGGCRPTPRRIDQTEDGVVAVLRDAARHPKAIDKALAAAVEAYRQDGDAEATAARLREVERQLVRLGAKQAAAAEAQIEGIMAGGDSAVYVKALRSLAQEKARLTAEREEILAAQSQRPRTQNDPDADFTRALADAERVLSSPQVPGATKRDIVGALVEKVYPLPDGVQVVFHAGVFTGRRTKDLSSSGVEATLHNVPMQT